MKTYCLIILMTLAGLTGCADNIRDAAPDVVAKDTRVITSAEGTVWRGPELEHRHYRTDLGGYDILSYGLMATKGTVANSVPHFQFWFSSHNGGKDRHYSIIRLADGSAKPMESQHHNSERCQEFANMTNACIYHDSGVVRFTRDELENAKNLGLKFHLSSGSENYEPIELPSRYIQGFLEAIR